MTEVTTERRESTIEELEREGDVAADFLEALLDIADIDGDLTLDVKNGRATVGIEASADTAAVSQSSVSLSSLSTPDAVQALQDITRLAVQNKTGEFSRVILDIGGSRDSRRRQLEALVETAAAKLAEGASQASLPSMSSYERKLIHDIAAERGLVSESYGEGVGRHTVLRKH